MSRLPSFYDPNRVGTLFYPDVAAIAADAAQADLSPALEDQQRNHLLIIDMQADFCHQGGTLFIPGAGEDVRRLVEFIYRQAAHITGITCSLDSHLPHQIFHSCWWADQNGKHPEPLTVISDDDVREKRWRPLMEPEWSTEYVRKLRTHSKKELVIWPYHVPIGGIGHVLDPELWSAVFWHSLARKSQPTWWRKGNIPGTEHYSIVQPEILVPDHPEGGRDQDFLDLLDQQDHIVVAGEAASHCVLETIEDLVDEFRDRPGALGRIFILRDCTSPVKHAEIDFEALTREQFARFQAEGVHFILSTDPLPF